MAERYPALYSHCTTPTQSVYAVITGGLRGHLVTRLSAIAAKELQDVQALLSHIRLTDAADERSSPFAAEDGALITSGLYSMIKSSREPALSAQAGFWSSRAPPRVQFFTWLLMHGRLQCRANLLRKKIVDDATCELCAEAAETVDHLLLHCPFAASFWQRL
jgi:hypothetical protein